MKKPLAIVAASLLGAAYAATLIIVAVSLVYEFVSHTGSIGAQHLDSNGTQGLIWVALAFLVGASLLGGGAYQIWVNRRPHMLVTPLAILLVIGCIGETADIIGTATASSNLIGVGVLVAMALPVGLVSTPSARAWFKQG